jgi:hypothetical protein
LKDRVFRWKVAYIAGDASMPKMMDALACKADFYAVLDRVGRTRRATILTVDGRPLARLEPPPRPAASTRAKLPTRAKAASARKKNAR